MRSFHYFRGVACGMQINMWVDDTLHLKLKHRRFSSQFEWKWKWSMSLGFLCGCSAPTTLCRPRSARYRDGRQVLISVWTTACGGSRPQSYSQKWQYTTFLWWLEWQGQFLCFCHLRFGSKVNMWQYLRIPAFISCYWHLDAFTKSETEHLSFEATHFSKEQIHRNGCSRIKLKKITFTIGWYNLYNNASTPHPPTPTPCSIGFWSGDWLGQS